MVALRKESVDRKHVVLVVPSGCWVALRKESVDRKVSIHTAPKGGDKSLSARRAWIENAGTMGKSKRAMSLSARRAWIEK